MSDLQAVRGMHDILPIEASVWFQVESRLRSIAEQYGYQEIRMPMLEKTSVFKRAIGDATDIVEKEMYTFEDRNGESLSLRPEGTASCVRACLEHGLLHNQIQRLYYMGPMFRHERPQKGRNRQFHQFGVEAFGVAGPEFDAEIIAMTAHFWDMFNISDSVRLEINTLGTLVERQEYRQALVSYFEKHLDQLDEDSKRRLEKNPLRILDSKNPEMKTLIQQAPKLMDFLSQESQDHFETLKTILQALNIPFVVNPVLVRGLDYYSHTVFEWVTEKLGAQGTICAGGRYDGLVTQFGGQPTPAFGFAAGLERLVLLLEAEGKSPRFQQIDAYFVLGEDDLTVPAFVVANEIRKALPNFQLMMNMGGGSFKNQLKRADKTGAALALILGSEEWAQGGVAVKFLRESRDQVFVKRENIVEWLRAQVGGNHGILYE